MWETAAWIVAMFTTFLLGRLYEILNSRYEFEFKCPRRDCRFEASANDLNLIERIEDAHYESMHRSF